MTNNKKAALEGYEKEYSQKTVKHRSGRVQARRIMEKKKGKAALKGKDVDHIDGNPNNNAPSNLRLIDRSKNRSNNGHHKGETYAKAKKGITNTFKKADDNFVQEFIAKAELMGSRGRAKYYKRPEPESRDYDYIVFTDNKTEQAELKKQLKALASQGFKIKERPEGFVTASKDNLDLSVYPVKKKKLIHEAWALQEKGVNKADAWSQVNASKQANMLNLALSNTFNRYWTLIAKKKD